MRLRDRVSARLPAFAAVLGTLAFVAAVSARKLADFDMPWHLAWGRYVAATHAVPRVDDFAYTHTAVHYVGLLADLALYGAYAALGPLGLQLTGGVVALGIAALLYETAGRGAVALAIVAFAMAAFSPWFLVRPATWSFLFFALDLCLIEAHRRAPESLRGRRALYALPIVHFVWAQCHGAGTLGLAVLFAYAAYRWAARALVTRPNAFVAPGDHVGAASATLAWLASCAAATLTPWGLTYFTAPARVMALGDLVTEWAASTGSFFVDDVPCAGAFIVFSWLVVAVGREADSPGRSRAPRVWDLGLVLLALVLATRVRFVPYTLVLLAPVVARRAAAALPSGSPLLKLLPWTTLVVAPLVVMTDRTPLGVGFDPLHFSEPSVAFIQRSALRGNMWNFPPFGGYLIWRLYPTHRVLMDGRIGFVHETETIRSVSKSDVDGRAFDELQRTYGIEWAVCGARQGEKHCLPVATSPAWTMVYWDDVAAIYVRKNGANDALAANGYRALRHGTPLEAVLDSAMASRETAGIVHDAELAVAQAPASPRALFLEACAAIALRDPKRGALAVERLATVAPDHPSIALLTAAWSSLR